MNSPKEVVEAYNFELWNKQRYELADVIIADQVVRHEVGNVKVLSRAESLQRVVNAWENKERLHFTLLHTIAEGDLVCIVYQCDGLTTTGDVIAIGSVEVFRVIDGQICEVWNAAHTRGSWK